jgi:hypothetical protein
VLINDPYAWLLRTLGRISIIACLHGRATTTRNAQKSREQVYPRNEDELHDALGVAPIEECRVGVYWKSRVYVDYKPACGTE